MLDASHLNSSIEQSSKCWPLAHLAEQLDGPNKKDELSIDLMYALAHATSDHKTTKVAGFSSGNKLFAFVRISMALNVFGNFSHKLCLCFSKISFIEVLHCFKLVIIIPCQTLSHKSCNLSNDFMILLIKKI